MHLENLNNLGLEALKKRDWVSSETYFSKSLKLDEKQPTILYMLGQSQRFLNKFPKAIVSLQKAISLQKHHKEWHLALGIAQQLNDQLDDSINAFRTANAIDPDYELPYNSAAISFRKKGDYIKADEVYDKGLISIARKFLNNCQNDESQKIQPFLELESTLYLDFMMTAMTEHCLETAEIHLLCFPTDDMATHELENKSHGGLLWRDYLTEDKKNARLYLPNCFDTLRIYLISQKSYSMFLENKGRNLFEMNKLTEAENCVREAEIFDTARSKHFP